jgi:hypothetical protein
MHRGLSGKLAHACIPRDGGAISPLPGETKVGYPGFQFADPMLAAAFIRAPGTFQTLASRSAKTNSGFVSRIVETPRGAPWHPLWAFSSRAGKARPLISGTGAACYHPRRTCPIHGQRSLRECSTTPGQADYFERGVCLGYIEGVFDSFQLWHFPIPLCAPSREAQAFPWFSSSMPAPLLERLRRHQPPASRCRSSAVSAVTAPMIGGAIDHRCLDRVLIPWFRRVEIRRVHVFPCVEQKRDASDKP